MQTKLSSCALQPDQTALGSVEANEAFCSHRFLAMAFFNWALLHLKNVGRINEIKGGFVYISLCGRSTRSVGESLAPHRSWTGKQRHGPSGEPGVLVNLLLS